MNFRKWFMNSLVVLCILLAVFACASDEKAQETSPGDNQTMDGDNETTPGDNETTPGDNETTPGDNETIPGDNETTPGDNETTPGSMLYSFFLKTGQTTSLADFDDGAYQYGDNRSYVRGIDNVTVYDQATGLMWQDDADAASVMAKWEGGFTPVALDICEDMELAGYEDWRLPAVEELETIIDLGTNSPAIDSIFKNTTSDHYWTSTPHVVFTNNVWSVSFYDGSTDMNTKSLDLYIRCVRDGQ